ncbi:MAG TPA: tetratricopeptide repeat protein [Verrucomicrobiae bacterium]|nr:tetratricopeptide repeat protein [Verrucomicrobiae bacterium]
MVKSALLVTCLVGVGWAGSPQLDEARRLFAVTDFEHSLSVLRAIPQKDAEVYELMGRNYYILADFRKASDSFEQAFNQQPSNSSYALWLARSYGRRAETSSVLTAPGLASKARQYFERAAQLNPRNIEALTDLFEYYLEAPGFLGGGYEKAQRIAAQIDQVDASEGHWAMYRLAEQRKDFSRAEEQLRRAVEAAPKQIGKLIDLARFLAKQGRYQEADQSIDRAEQVAPDSARLVFVRADIYIRSNRNLDQARSLLQKYLSLNLTPDDPPRADAARLLRKISGG